MAVAGNSCIYCLYVVFNCLLLVEALLVIGLGGWLWYEVGSPEVFAIIFIVLGNF